MKHVRVIWVGALTMLTVGLTASSATADPPGSGRGTCTVNGMAGFSGTEEADEIECKGPIFDHITGNGGDDSIRLDGILWSGKELHGGSGNDTITITAPDAVAVAGRVYGDEGNDIITVKGNVDDGGKLLGGPGSDTIAITGRGGPWNLPNTVWGYVGGDDGDDTINLGDVGGQQIDNSGISHVVGGDVAGGNGNDKIKVRRQSSGGSTIKGGPGDDIIDVLMNQGTIDGGDGTDNCGISGLMAGTRISCE